MRTYKAWVKRHAEALSVVETALATVTWLLPDRFSQNEFALEGVHTLANLISVFHDSILNELGDNAPDGAQELTLALNALQQVEVLVELYSLYSNKAINRYDALLVVESLKALVRIAIHRKSNRLLLLQGGAEGMFDGEGGSSKPLMVLKAFQSFRKARTPWIKDDRLHRIEKMMEQANQSAYKRLFAGEMLHIVRPLVYVATLRVWGLKSWKPWLISLLVELISAQSTRSACISSEKSSIFAADELSSSGSTLAGLYYQQGIRLGPRELDEITRRKLLLLYYLLRDPMFSKTTHPAMLAWIRATSRIPLVGRPWAGIQRYLVGLVTGIQKYYSYTSGA
jgi:peroxin-16